MSDLIKPPDELKDFLKTHGISWKFFISGEMNALGNKTAKEYIAQRIADGATQSEAWQDIIGLAHRMFE